MYKWTLAQSSLTYTHPQKERQLQKSLGEECGVLLVHLLNATKHGHLGHLGVTEGLSAIVLFWNNKMSKIFLGEEVHLCGHVFNSVILLSTDIFRIHYKYMNKIDKMTNVECS